MYLFLGLTFTTFIPFHYLLPALAVVHMVSFLCWWNLNSNSCLVTYWLFWKSPLFFFSLASPSAFSKLSILIVTHQKGCSFSTRHLSTCHQGAAIFTKVTGGLSVLQSPTIASLMVLSAIWSRTSGNVIRVWQLGRCSEGHRNTQRWSMCMAG